MVNNMWGMVKTFGQAADVHGWDTRDKLTAAAKELPTAENPFTTWERVTYKLAFVYTTFKGRDGAIDVANWWSKLDEVAPVGYYSISSKDYTAAGAEVVLFARMCHMLPPAQVDAKLKDVTNEDVRALKSEIKAWWAARKAAAKTEAVSEARLAKAEAGSKRVVAPRPAASIAKAELELSAMIDLARESDDAADDDAAAKRGRDGDGDDDHIDDSDDGDDGMAPPSAKRMRDEVGTGGGGSARDGSDSDGGGDGSGSDSEESGAGAGAGAGGPARTKTKKKKVAGRGKGKGKV